MKRDIAKSILWSNKCVTLENRQFKNHMGYQSAIDVYQRIHDSMVICVQTEDFGISTERCHFAAYVHGRIVAMGHEESHLEYVISP